MLCVFNFNRLHFDFFFLLFFSRKKFMQTVSLGNVKLYFMGENNNNNKNNHENFFGRLHDVLIRSGQELEKKSDMVEQTV